MTTKIVIDPGHGGHDSGATGNGFVEKDLVLEMSKMIEQKLQGYDDVEVKLTRTDDTFIELSDRAKIARDFDADVFVSAHFNGFNGRAKGTETFKHNNSSASSSLQKNLHDAIKSAVGSSDRGLKNANFAVLRGTYQSMLSVLTEPLFLDNDDDAEILKQDGMLEKIADAHVEGIAKEKSLSGSPASTDSASSSSGSSGSGSTTFTDLSNDKKYDEMKKAVEDQGYTFKQFQHCLLAVGEKLPRYGADGHPGAETLSATEAFQSRHGVSSESGSYFGRPGPATIAKIESELPSMDRVLRANSPYPSGSDVRAIQRAAGYDGSGSYGPNTASAVESKQRELNISVDGVFGPETRQAMFNQ